MSAGKKFDTMFDELFGDAQVFVPDPIDIEEAEGEFDALDEDDVGGEEDLDDVDCSDIPADDDEDVDVDEDAETDEGTDEDIDLGDKVGNESL